jgi:dipeptidase D
MNSPERAQAMSSAIEGLKPEGVWRSFAEISTIPRCSKHEAAISKHVLATARKLGLEAAGDSVGNVVVRKPASPGHGSVRSLCLQGHLDMVCEKLAGSPHDFSKDPIELVRREGVLTANGTTLGADNGIAVATCLAIMADRTLEHGPLEFLFTVDEETGLTGANNLQPGFVQSRLLLNLDSEEEGALYVGCAGGRDTTGSWELAQEPVPAGSAALQISVRGLRGGHSGLEIDKGRGNAVKILARTLSPLAAHGARLASIHGGNKHNAIPREAEATVWIPRKKLEDAATLIEDMAGTIGQELASVEPELKIAAAQLPKARGGKVFRKSLQKKLLQTLIALPHGVIKMSADIPGLVETSTNLAVIRTERKEVRVVTSQRSSVASENDEICDVVRTVFEMGGATPSSSHGYPGWKPDMDSEILRIARETYQSLFGKDPDVKAIHAGLECGIIGEKYPGMDMVSFGPTLEGVHTAEEQIHIDTVERYWTFLLAILKRVR